MSEETQAIDYEAMKEELDKAEYDVFSSAGWRTIGEWRAWGIGGHGVTFYGKNEHEAIDKAWAHYQKERRYQAMEALLREMIGE